MSTATKSHLDVLLRHAHALVAASLALLLLASWTTRYIGTALGHDQLSYLMEAERFLKGYEIYGPHLSETNPPIIIWFSAIPIMLTRHFSVSAEICLRALVLLILCLSALWCARLVQLGNRCVAGWQPALYGVTIVAVALQIGAYDFGQREHLLVILLLPYLVGTATGAVTRVSFVERCSLGIAAGCAMWFKPQDILVVVALEVAFALCARTLRHLISVEFVTMSLAASFLFLLVLLLTPQYVHQVIPLLADVYWAFGTNTSTSLLFGSHYYLLTILFTSLCIFTLRHRLADKTTPIALLACSIGGYVAYALQHTMWPYHRYPHQAFCLLAFTYMLLDALDSWISSMKKAPLVTSRTALSISACAFILFSVLALHPHILTSRLEHPGPKPLDLFLEQVQPGSTVSALSTNVVVSASVYNHGLQWGSRFAHLWMLPAIIQNEMGRTASSSPFKQLPAQTISRLAALQRKEVTEDLQYWFPEFVLVPICNPGTNCQGMEGKNLDLVAWFKQSPAFAEAWSRYQQQPGIDGFYVYRLTR